MLWTYLHTWNILSQTGHREESTKLQCWLFDESKLMVCEIFFSCYNFCQVLNWQNHLSSQLICLVAFSGWPLQYLVIWQLNNVDMAATIFSRPECSQDKDVKKKQGKKYAFLFFPTHLSLGRRNYYYHIGNLIHDNPTASRGHCMMIYSWLFSWLHANTSWTVVQIIFLERKYYQWASFPSFVWQRKQIAMGQCPSNSVSKTSPYLEGLLLLKGETNEIGEITVIK